MVKQRVPSLCIYCENFPCVKGDGKFSVLSEIKHPYPFLNEQDDFKPCDGKKFVPVNFVIEEEPPAGTMADPIPLPPGPTFSPPLERIVKVLNATMPTELEVKLQKMVDDKKLVSFEIKGFASVYDSASSQTKLVAVVYLKREKDSDDELADISLM